MKGVMLIVMLLALLVTGYLVVADIQSKQGEKDASIQAIEKASQVQKKLDRAGEATEKRIKDILDE